TTSEWRNNTRSRRNSGRQALSLPPRAAGSPAPPDGIEPRLVQRLGPGLHPALGERLLVGGGVGQVGVPGSVHQPLPLEQLLLVGLRLRRPAAGLPVV